MLATEPNQVWSWDITKLRAAHKWTHYYLYVLLDIFSRYVVGWMLTHRESGEFAAELLEQSVHKQGVDPEQLTVHADRGSAPTSKTLKQMMVDLGVHRSHSRPRVSNDNPFSESNFHTLKSRPDYPNRFGSFEDARSFCRRTFDWYNHPHHHSGIAMLTPAQVHHGHSEGVLAARQRVLDRAYAAHSDRFVNGPPKVPMSHRTFEEFGAGTSKRRTSTRSMKSLVGLVPMAGAAGWRSSGRTLPTGSQPRAFSRPGREESAALRGLGLRVRRR